MSLAARLWRHVVPGGIIAVVFGLAAGAHPAAAGQALLELPSDNATAARQIELLIDLTGATVTISRDTNTDAVLRARVDYPDGGQVPELRSGLTEDTLSAVLSSGSGREQHWDIVLGDCDVPLLLTCQFSDTVAEADLGGVPLLSCVLLVDHGDLVLSFGTPTTRQVEILLAVAVASTVDLAGIGNSDADSFGLLCTGSTIALDCSGAWAALTHSASVLALRSAIQVGFSTDTGARLLVRRLGGSLEVTGERWERVFCGLLCSGFEAAGPTLESPAIAMEVRAVGSPLAVSQ